MKVRKRIALNILVLLTLLWISYALFGERLIRDMYEGKSIGILNSIISGQNVHGVDFYIGFLHSLLTACSVLAAALCLLMFLPSQWMLSLFSVLFLILFLEAGLRIYEGYWSFRYPGEVDSESLWTHDPVLGWKGEPHSEGLVASPRGRFSVKLKYNSKGLRDDEYPYEKPADTKRILLLGDSLMAGTEVERDEVTDVRLESLLTKRGRFEVINAGTRGYGTDQTYLFLTTEGYKYSPDAVIYAFYQNDWLDNMIVHRPGAKFEKPYFLLDEEGQLVLKGLPVAEHFKDGKNWKMATPEISQTYNRGLPENKEKGYFLVAKVVLDQFRLYHFFHSRWQLNKRAEFEKNRPRFIQEHSEKITKALIGAIRDFTAEKNMRFLVYEIRNVRHSLDKVSPLKKICEDLNVDYKLAFENLSEYEKNPKIFHIRDDIHFNGRGHQAAARELYSYLDEIVSMPAA